MSKRKPKRLHKQVGRPLIVTSEVVAKLEQGFTNDFNVLEACLFAGISKDAYYDFLKANPEYSDRFDLLRNSLKLQAKANVSSALKANDKDMTRWYLERRGKDEFSTRNENTGKDGGPEIVNIHIHEDGHKKPE